MPSSNLTPSRMISLLVIHFSLAVSPGSLFGWAPQDSFVYVLDQGGGGNASLLVVDLDRGLVARRIEIGADPDIVLVADSNKLVVLQEAEIAVVDPSNGFLTASTPVPNRLERSIDRWIPLMVTGAGVAYIPTTLSAPGADACYTVIVAFDPEAGALNGMQAGLPDCDGWLVNPMISTYGLRIVPTNRNSVYSIEWGSEGRSRSDTMLLPSKSAGRVLPQGRNVAAVLTADESTLIIIKENASVISVDLMSRSVIRFTTGPRDTTVYPQAAVLIESTLFLGIIDSTRQLADQEHLPNRILAVDVNTLESLFTTDVQSRFTSLTSVGGLLYVPAVRDRSLVVIDPMSGDELRRISGVGAAPVRVLANR